MATRIDNVQVAGWFQNRAGNNHNVLDNNNRPPIGMAIENPTNEDITVTIPAGQTVYLPSVFANQYSGTTVEFKAKTTVITIPNDAKQPVLKSGKVKAS